jgi:hypothetical protein
VKSLIAPSFYYFHAAGTTKLFTFQRLHSFALRGKQRVSGGSDNSVQSDHAASSSTAFAFASPTAFNNPFICQNRSRSYLSANPNSAANQLSRDA